MKIILPLLFAAILTSPVIHAQETKAPPAAEATPKAAKKKKVRSVKEALPQMSFFNAQPNPSAQYYIFLRSASWCGPCQQEMPEIVKLYADMKKSKKVELILWGADRDEASAKKFLEQHKAPFPGVMDASILTELQAAPSVPHAYILDKKGKLLFRGHGSIVKNWKYATLDYRKNKKEIQARMKALTGKK